MPTIEDIKKAIADPSAIQDPCLSKYTYLPGMLGPLFFPGGFGVVFPLQNDKNEKYAFRVWRNEIIGIKERMSALTSYLKEFNLPYFVKYEYVSGGLIVEGSQGVEKVDTLRMEWTEGDNLKEYIRKLIKHSSLSEGNIKNILKELAESFRKMFHDLHMYSISHGDLQHANIIVQDSKTIKLIDYDTVYVPTLGRLRPISSGVVHYQHPARKKSVYCNEKTDYFSELIIYLSVLSFSENPALWDKYDVGISDQDFFFSESDFTDLKNGEKYKDISRLGKPFVFLLKVLNYYLSRSDIDQLEPFDVVAGRMGYLLPSLVPSLYCIKCGHRFFKGGGRYCINCGVKLKN